MKSLAVFLRFSVRPSGIAFMWPISLAPGRCGSRMLRDRGTSPHWARYRMLDSGYALGAKRYEAGLLIVDPLAAAYACNENDRGLVRAFMASWDAWARDTGCTVLLIAHPPKTDAAYSGSTDWHAAARAVWTLRLYDTGTGDATGKGGGKREPATAPRLQCLKSSYGLPPEPQWLERNGNWRVAQDAGAAARHWADGKQKSYESLV